MVTELRRYARILPVMGLLATLGVFLVLVVLQSRWINQFADTDLQRSQLRLQESMTAIRTDVNSELTKAYALFQFEPATTPESWGQTTVENYAIWRRQAKFPPLVQRLLLVQPESNGQGLQMAAFDANTKGFAKVAWPDELSSLRELLTLPFRRVSAFGFHTFTGVALADRPVLVCPIRPTFMSPFNDATGWLVIDLNRQFLLTEMLPQIMRAHMEPPDQFDYQIRRSDPPAGVVYKSSSAVQFESVDAHISLLEIGQQYFPHGIGGSVRRHQILVRENVDRAGEMPAVPGEGGVWQFQVKHRLGSLNAAAMRLRRSNLSMSFAMIALVALDLSVLALLARRAHRLGNARLEFAATVSHELRTPLAAISSAADNLAAGVTYEPSKVKQYGAAILNQSRQLTEMVEQILAFAGGQFGKKHFESDVLEPGTLVARAIAAVGPAARAAGVEIEQHIAEELPQLLGDAAAIEQAVINLLTNAIKYAAEGRWIGVSVSGENKNRGLAIRVEDKGPGIPALEQKRIFEPFYRGSVSRRKQQHGGGLGLTLVDQIVRAHSGRITLTSSSRGSCFTLHLPAL